MEAKIRTTVKFFEQLLGGQDFDAREVHHFGLCLAYFLRQRYNKDGTYLRICPQEFDPTLAVVCEVCQFSVEEVKKNLPSYLEMWIDPDGISYRLSETGPIYNLK